MAKRGRKPKAEIVTAPVAVAVQPEVSKPAPVRDIMRPTPVGEPSVIADIGRTPPMPNGMTAGMGNNRISLGGKFPPLSRAELIKQGYIKG